MVVPEGDFAIRGKAKCIWTGELDQSQERTFTVKELIAVEQVAVT